MVMVYGTETWSLASAGRDNNVEIGENGAFDGYVDVWCEVQEQSI